LEVGPMIKIYSVEGGCRSIKYISFVLRCEVYVHESGGYLIPYTWKNNIVNFSVLE